MWVNNLLVAISAPCFYTSCSKFHNSELPTFPLNNWGILVNCWTIPQIVGINMSSSKRIRTLLLIFFKTWGFARVRFLHQPPPKYFSNFRLEVRHNVLTLRLALKRQPEAEKHRYSYYYLFFFFVNYFFLHQVSPFVRIDNIFL